VTWALAVSREFLERALTLARSRQAVRTYGERVCELMELEELEELRMLRTPNLSPAAIEPPAAHPAAMSPRMRRFVLRALRRTR
jgi:hypothetical protein